MAERIVDFKNAPAFGPLRHRMKKVASGEEISPDLLVAKIKTRRISMNSKATQKRVEIYRSDTWAKVNEGVL